MARRPWIFDLETAISTWRRAIASSPWMSDADIDELERHIRDHVEASDRAPEQAFRDVLRELGQLNLIEAEYEKVYWAKLRRERRIGSELAAGLAQTAKEARLSLRNARRHPGYTALTICSLAVGIGCAVVIALFARHETSFDAHHSRADRIVRVVTERTSAASQIRTVDTPMPLAPALAESYPFVQAAARFDRLYSGVFTAGNRSFHESDVFLADPSIFDIFDVEFVQGSASGALETSDGIIVTEQTARRYFGDGPVIGQPMTFTYEGSTEYVVQGVVRSQPETSHFHFDFLVPVPEWMAAEDSWAWDVAPTYVLLDRPASVDDLAGRLPDLVERRFVSEDGSSLSLSLQPLTSIHLHSRLDGEHEPNGSMNLLLVMAAVGVMILLIACINFVNLATARAASRAREVGVRKAIGVSRSQLFRQFVGESVMTALFSSAVGLALAAAFLPLFNRLTGAALSLDESAAAFIVPVTLGLALFAGVIAGLYPALILSAFDPVDVLKGRLSAGSGGSLLRRSLVVAQFAVGIFFLIGLLVVNDQLTFVRTQDPGYDAEQIIYIRSPQRMTPTPYEAIKSELSSVPGVVSVAGLGAVPGADMQPGRAPVGLASTTAEDLVESAIYFVHPDFFETYGLQWTDPPETLVRADSARIVVVNETAARALGLDEPGAASELDLYFRDLTTPTATVPVAGRFRDIHFESFHSSIRPMVLIVAPVVHTWTYIAARIDTRDLSTTLTGIETAWLEHAPEWPAEIAFLDDQARSQYVRESRIGSVFSVFSVLAMIIAALGLVGLATFGMQRRRKEIGIRKVLGAGVRSLFVRMSTEYLVLVGVALVVALPPAWIVMNGWLDGFAYRVDIDPANFLIAGGVTLALTLISTGFQVLRASMADPVDSLRLE
ncbi:MAG: FtsX-like permease family protein [Rhodothermales bacterium]|nr:FtsX-like permease family protein [Rhodothermales bacterium]